MNGFLSGGGACLSGFGAVFALAVVTEALTEIVKRVWSKAPTQLVAIIWGVALALLCRLDIFSLLGCTEAVPYAGSVITGVLMSRGSNWLHELWEKAGFPSSLAGGTKDGGAQ